MAANPPVHAGHSICYWRAAGALGGAAAGVGVVMTDASEALARALMESGVFYDGVQRRLEQSLAEQGFALVPLEPPSFWDERVRQRYKRHIRLVRR